MAIFTYKPVDNDVTFICTVIYMIGAVCFLLAFLIAEKIRLFKKKRIENAVKEYGDAIMEMDDTPGSVDRVISALQQMIKLDPNLEKKESRNCLNFLLRLRKELEKTKKGAT